MKDEEPAHSSSTALSHLPGSDDDSSRGITEAGTDMRVGITNAVANVGGTQLSLAGVDELAGYEDKVDDEEETTNQPSSSSTSHHPGRTDDDDISMKTDQPVGCSYDDSGLCEYHGMVGVQLWKPRSVWSQRKNGTYGWRAVRSYYWTCKRVTRTKSEAGPKPTFILMRNSGDGTGGNFTGRDTEPFYGGSSRNVQADRASRARRHTDRI